MKCSISEIILLLSQNETQYIKILAFSHQVTASHLMTTPQNVDILRLSLTKKLSFDIAFFLDYNRTYAKPFILRSDTRPRVSLNRSF